MSDTLEVRIAHLEGAYEQVDKRLGGVESALIHLRSDMNSCFTRLSERIERIDSKIDSKIDSFSARIDGRIDAQTGRMDSQFHWLLGTILTTWVTMLLAIFFRH